MLLCISPFFFPFFLFSPKQIYINQEQMQLNSSASLLSDKRIEHAVVAIGSISVAVALIKTTQALIKSKVIRLIVTSRSHKLKCFAYIHRLATTVCQ